MTTSAALHAAGFQVEQRGEAEAGDGVDVTAHQHGFAQRRVHRGPGHVVDLVGLLEDRESLAAGVEHRRAEFLAVQVGGLGDAALLQREHGGRRVVVDHHHGHRLVGRVRVVGVEFHQRGHVGKTHVVGARGHAGDRAARAVARVDGHVQAGGLEVALGSRLQEQGGRAFEAPVELELDGGLGMGAAEGSGCGQGCGGLEEVALVHEGSWKQGKVTKKETGGSRRARVQFRQVSKKGASCCGPAGGLGTPTRL